MTARATLPGILKLNALLFCVCFCCNSLQAQYVAIPDSGFAAWLAGNGYLQCMQGNRLDTTCTAVLTAKSLNTSYRRIRTLEGVQYFRALDSLKCNSDTTLTYIPALSKRLRVLECRNDSLTTLPTLPDSLIRLACEFNVLDSIAALPSTLSTFTCYNNKLNGLPTLPAGLKALYCSGNKIDSLPALPDSLVVLSCYSNKLAKLPALPGMLRDLLCSNNLLTTLPALPALLKDLSCYSNKLTALPALPDSLSALSCSHNRLTTLPALPNSLTIINCENNSLTGLPALPDSLFQLFIDNNPSLLCLPQLNTIVDFEFYNTHVVCLPNNGNIYISNPDTLKLCDSTNNTHGCLQISAVKEISKPSFTLYPNPARNFVVVAIEQNAIGGDLRVFDNEGRQVRSSKLQMLNERIETTNLAVGNYVVLINDQQGRTAVNKLVIQ